MKPAFDRDQLIRRAWITGDLDYKVKPYQLVVWEPIKQYTGLDRSLSNSTAVVVAQAQAALTMNISRRFGKTTLCFLALLMLSIKNPKHTYLFCAPTEGDAKDIIGDISPVLLDDCPSDLKPKYKAGVFYFNNGSRIKIGGTWNGAEGLRGKTANGVVVDEAAHIPQHSSTSCLNYVLGSVLQPQLLTTQGFTLIASTPPPSLKHDFVRILREAELNGSLLTFDIYDNKSLTEQQIDKAKRDSYMADPTGSSWKREFLVLLVPDSASLIIPEDVWIGTPRGPVDVTLINGYEHLQKYIVFDHGTKDLNVILFAFYDYENARTVIQRELVLRNGPNTDTIGKEIARVRKELWGTMPVFRSVCDSISRQIILDLNQHKDIKEAGITFINPSKIDLEGMVNQLIVQMSQGKYIIDTGCEVLIDTCNTGTWKASNSGKREFARLGEIGHCDALACMVYLQRALIRSVNPFANVRHLNMENVMIIERPIDNSGYGILANAMKGPKRNSWSGRR